MTDDEYYVVWDMESANAIAEFNSDDQLTVFLSSMSEDELDTIAIQIGTSDHITPEGVRDILRNYKQPEIVTEDVPTPRLEEK